MSVGTAYLDEADQAIVLGDFHLYALPTKKYRSRSVY
jgi:hypothetical protein